MPAKLSWAHLAFLETASVSKLGLRLNRDAGVGIYTVQQDRAVHMQKLVDGPSGAFIVAVVVDNQYPAGDKSRI